MRHRRPTRRRSLRLESLESRSLLATLTVNSTEDSNEPDDVLTLREAILLVNFAGDANAALGDDLSNDEAARINTTEPFGTNDKIVFTANLANEFIRLDEAAVAGEQGLPAI